MAVQHRKIIRMQKMFIPDLDAVIPVPGQFCQELVEGLTEVASAGKIARVEMRELKDHKAEVLLERLAGAEETRYEEVGV